MHRDMSTDANFCLMLDIYYHTYSMLVYVKCIYSRYAGKIEKQTTSLRVGVELDIPRSLILNQHLSTLSNNAKVVLQFL